MNKNIKKSVENYREELEEIFKKAEEKEGKNLFEHFVELAYEDNKVLIALMNKIIPNLKKVDAEVYADYQGQIDLSHLTDEELDERIEKLESQLARTERAEERAKKELLRDDNTKGDKKGKK